MPLSVPKASLLVILLLLTRGIRGFAYGFLNTILGLYLALIGYSLIHVALLLRRVVHG